MRDAIKLENICKHIGRREILKDVSFTVKQGDIFGYLGPNGAGKTTTIRVLLGLLEVTSGKASILGQDVNATETRRKLGFVMESDGLYDNMTAYDNVAYYSRIYGVSRVRERINIVLGLVKLFDKADDKVGTYSKGMRQRLALARAMVHDPEILILDEPTASVDPSGQIEIRQIILDMAHKEFKTIFLSSHNLDEVQRICNRIALIHKGDIKLYGERDELQRKMSEKEVIIETAEAMSELIIAELQSFPELSIHDRKNKTLILSLGKGGSIPDIVTFLTQRGVRIEQVKRREASLEQIYTTILKEAEPR
jgi:ABC-2 type transport system ATP-binding protein